MADLHRDLAPVSEQAWTEIDAEATRTIKATLGGRRLVDFAGPLGWTAGAVNMGRTDRVKEADGVEIGLRRVLPLTELRVEFDLPRREVDAIDRGARDPDLGPVHDAARRIALAEDRAVFRGLSEASIVGLMSGAEHPPLHIDPRYENYPSMVARALGILRNAGVGGPYGIALGTQCYTGLSETTVGGYPVIEHVRRLVGGPLVWAPAVEGAVLLSLRGDDFLITVGRDFAIGYVEHTPERIRLFVCESFTFQLLSPEAAVPLIYPERATGKAQ